MQHPQAYAIVPPDKQQAAVTERDGAESVGRDGGDEGGGAAGEARLADVAVAGLEQQRRLGELAAQSEINSSPDGGSRRVGQAGHGRGWDLSAGGSVQGSHQAVEPVLLCGLSQRRRRPLAQALRVRARVDASRPPGPDAISHPDRVI